MDRYLVISADGHAGPPAHVYREYLDPQYREQFDEQNRQALALRAASPFGTGLAAGSQSDPHDEGRRILGGTAAELYGVDVDALQPLVDRICPTLDEVHGDGVELAAPAEAIA